MYNWFECKVRYDKTQDDGMIRTVTESFLLDALSYTEAEQKIIEEVTPFISGEFSIVDIKRRKFAETFLNDSGDRFYKVRLQFLSLDEKSGTEKRTNVNMLVQASTLKEALETVEKEMEKTMIDYEFHTIIETPILDIFLYQSKEVEP